MFEEKAEEIANKKLCATTMCYNHCNFNSPKHHRCGEWHRIYECVKESAEFGYNKAKVEVEDSYRESLCNSELNLASVTEQLEELNKANEWQFVSEKGLPKESGRYLVYVGGGENGVYPLDFETEYNDFGYWCLIVNSASLGVTDTIFETITERNEDKVIAWKEIVFPKEK